LESQLLGTATAPCQRITSCLAPSWTWASLDGPCCLERPSIYFGQIIHTYVTVQQVDIIGRTSAAPHEERYAGLSGSYGRLRILCEHLFQITISPQERTNSTMIRIPAVVGRMKLSVHTSFDCQSAYDTARTSPIKPFFIPVQIVKKFQTEECMKFEGNVAVVSGLMIEETGKEKGQFRRVGCLSGRLENLFLLQGASVNSAYHIDDSKCVQIFVNSNGQKRFIINLV
jgi:hypothetical protein